MSFLLVPNEVTTTTATIWIGAINEIEPSEAGNLRLFCNGVEKPITGVWKSHRTTSGLRIVYQFFPVPGLLPREGAYETKIKRLG